MRSIHSIMARESFLGTLPGIIAATSCVLAAGCAVSGEPGPNVARLAADETSRTQQKSLLDRPNYHSPKYHRSAEIDELRSDDPTEVAETDIRVKWAASIEEAKKRAQAEDKPILIAFSARRQESEKGHQY